MKKIFLAIFVITLSAILFTACKKDDDNPSAVTAKVQGKWLFDKQIFNDYSGGTSYRDTTLGTVNDFVEFKSDNTVTAQIDGDVSTSNYQVLGTNKLITWDPLDPTSRDTATIQTLTNSQFVIYSKEVDGSDYSESTIYLKK